METITNEISNIKLSLEQLDQAFKSQDWNIVHNCADRIKTSSLKILEEEMYKGVDSPYE